MDRSTGSLPFLLPLCLRTLCAIALTPAHISFPQGTISDWGIAKPYLETRNQGNINNYIKVKSLHKHYEWIYIV